MNKVVCWFLGIGVGIVGTVGVEAATLALVPSGILFNSFGTDIVGEGIASQGLLPLLINYQDLKVGDFPVVKTVLDQVFAEGGMGDYVTFDYDAIKDCKFADGSLSKQMPKAIKITATLNSLDVNLGDFGKLAMFKEWTEVTPSEEDFASNPSVYYYKDAQGKYERAFDDEGKPANGFVAGGQLYLANLSQIAVTELFASLSVRMKDLTYKEFMTNLMGQSEEQLANDPVYKLIGNVKLSELSSVDTGGFVLMDIVAETSNNKLLYDILEDLSETPRAEITLAQLSNLNLKNAKLKTIISPSENAKLYAILNDMTGKGEDEVTLGDLDGMSVDSIKISSVISDGENIILKKLIEKDTTIGNIGTEISALTINELFGSDCFTSDATQKVNDDVYYLDGVDYVYTNDLPDGKTAHYISKDAGVWLLFAFDANEVSVTNGRAGRFTPSTITFNSLQEDATYFSDAISNSTLYQLISAKVINDKPYSDAAKAMTLNQALALVGI